MKNRLQKLRKEKLKLSQKEIADRINTTRATYGRYETGEISIPPEHIILSICREFNVNEEWLRFGTGEMFKEMTEQDLIKQKIDNQLKDGDEFTKNVLYQIASLTPEEWKAIEEFIYKIKK